MARDDAEAAYFALLRAKDEVTALQRYDEYLGDEARRLRRSLSEADALATQAPARLHRRLAHTDAALAEAARLRLEVIAEERRRLPEQIEAAQAWVAECEAEHERLRAS